MFQRFNFFYWFLVISFFLASCKKSNSGKNELGNLNLMDVYGLIIPNDSVTPSIPTSNKILYKLSSSDNIDPITYLNIEGYNMGGFAPEYFYTLNDQYFLATFSIIGSAPKSIVSFIIKYSDGKVFKLPEGFYPRKMIGGMWKQDTIEKPIKAGPNSSFYFRGEDRIYKISQTALDLFETDVIGIAGTSSDIFDIDSEGDIMVGDKIYTSPTISYDSKVYDASNCFVSSSFSNSITNIGGFSIVKLTNNQIQTFHLYIQNNVLKEDTISLIPDQGTGWHYRGSYKFLNPNQLIHVFDKGLIKIDLNGASPMVLSGNLTLNSIELVDQSKSLLYIVATNSLNEKILLQVNPGTDPATFSEVFAPNKYYITHINVLGNDNVMFQAKLLNSNTKIFGYFSTIIEKEVINYQNITAYQLITIK